MRALLAVFALLFAACRVEPELGGYAGGVPTLAPAPDCIAADDIDQDSGRIIEDVIICGELDAAAVDTFTVVNVEAFDRELHVETFGPGGCSGDTDLVVEDLGSGEILTFDEELGIGPCAWITVPIPARQALTVKVVAVEAGPYQLAVEIFDL